MNGDVAFSNERDARALDAFVDANFDLDRVEPEVRDDAERVARLLGLLDSGSSSHLGGKRLRIERVLSALGEAPGDTAPVLDDLSDAAVESYVMSGFRADRVPSALAGRAKVVDRIGHGLTTLSSEGEAWVNSTRHRRIEATLSAVESSEAPLEFEPVSSTRGSFRMADVVAAASILLLLSAVFVPALSAYRSNVQRSACLGNMSQAAQGFGMYAGDYRESLPMATAGFGGSWMEVGTTPERSNSANLFTLVRTGHAGLDALACPGNDRAPTRVLEPEAVDWRSLDEVSYSYRIMSPRVAKVAVLSGRAVVMADRSPVVIRASRGEPIIPEANSPNHGGEGQHVLRVDGTVQWTESPVVRGDNIWLPRPIEQVIHSVRSRVGLVKGNELPDSPDDAFLGP